MLMMIEAPPAPAPGARHATQCPAGGDHNWVETGFGIWSCTKCFATKGSC